MTTLERARGYTIVRSNGPQRERGDDKRFGWRECPAGEGRLRAAAERYPNPWTDWRILAKPLSGAFGLGHGTKREMRQKRGFIRYRGFASGYRIKAELWETRRCRCACNVVYVISLCPILIRGVRIIAANSQGRIMQFVKSKSASWAGC